MVSLEMSLLEQPTYIGAVLGYLSRSNYAPYRNFALEAREDLGDAYLRLVKILINRNIGPSGSGYWKQRAKEKKITPDDINKADTLRELLLKVGETNTSPLTREDGYNKFFKPQDIDVKNLYKSSSSGTTGEPKSIYHSPEALMLSGLNLYYGLKEQIGSDGIKQLRGKNLLSLGPLGAYQEMHKSLADMLGMNHINLGFDTTGLKKLPPEESIRRIKPAIEKVNEGKNVGLLTTSKEALPWIKTLDYIPIVLLSGTGIDASTIKEYEKEHPSSKFIPVYGHYAAMSSAGFVRGDKIIYYPSFPATNFLVVDKKYFVVDYGAKDDILMILARREFLSIKMDDRGIRERPQNPFSFDGVSDISR